MKKLLLIGFVLVAFAECRSKKAIKVDETKFYEGERVITDAQFAPLTLPYQVIEFSKVSDTMDIENLNFIGNDIIIMDSDNRVFVTDSAQKNISFPGKGLKMVSGLSILVKNDNQFLVQDLTRNELYEFVRQPASRNWSVSKAEVLPDALTGIVSMAQMPDSTLIATSVNHIEGKVIHFTPDTPHKVLGYIGTIPFNKDISQFVLAMAYRSTCIYDKSANKIYVAHFYTDLLESYNPDGTLSFRVHGPGNFKSVYRIAKQMGYQVFANTNESRKAFLDIACDDKYIYALYAGHPMDNVVRKKTLLIYKKNGDPYKKLVVEENIHQIELDERNKRLYGFKRGVKAFGLKKAEVVWYDVSNI